LKNGANPVSSHGQAGHVLREPHMLGESLPTIDDVILVI
jgi:hypothetical protein